MATDYSSILAAQVNYDLMIMAILRKWFLNK